LARCREARIVSGFATPDGVAALRVGASAPKITRLVLGAGTFKAFAALEGLIAAGLPAHAARVHLGFSRHTGWPNSPFERMRPMLHSKIYYFEMPDGEAAAVVGSHNLTGFALRGMNAEAAVLLEGRATDPAFADVRAHIEESYSQAQIYNTALKEAYARWYADYLERLRIEIGDMPRAGVGGRTLVLMAEAATGSSPAVGQAIYFDLDKRIERVSAIDAEVHLHLFRQLPSSPRAALASLRGAGQTYRAKVQAIDARAGSAEIDADWLIDGNPPSQLKQAPRPFRPSLRPGRQQVTVQIESPLSGVFEYEFEPAERWLPELGSETLVDDETEEVWSPVMGLFPERRSPAIKQRSSQELMELSPDSGSYILLSRGRRRLSG
jgi:hypothetical protein